MRVRNEAMSLPASGSENACAQVSSPRSDPGSNSSERCGANTISTGTRISSVQNGSGIWMSLSQRVWNSAARQRGSPPRPPARSGQPNRDHPLSNSSACSTPSPIGPAPSTITAASSKLGARRTTWTATAIGSASAASTTLNPSGTTNAERRETQTNGARPPFNGSRYPPYRPTLRHICGQAWCMNNTNRTTRWGRPRPLRRGRCRRCPRPRSAQSQRTRARARCRGRASSHHPSTRRRTCGGRSHRCRLVPPRRAAGPDRVREQAPPSSRMSSGA